jgi:maltoporin
MTSDAGTRNALAENSLKRKVRVGNGHKVYFDLTLSQVEQAIQLLERLEAKREAKSLPDIGVGQDSLIFTNAIADFKQCIMSA